jgi:hypothetical protein
MPRFDHPILKEVAALGMPRPNEVVINHGAALVARGVRAEHEIGDIDFSTSLENIIFLREELGWRAVSMVVGRKGDGTDMTMTATRDSRDRFDAHRWDFSPPRYRRTGKGRIYLPEQLERAEQDEDTGIYVATLEYVRETKQGTDRAKDREDIELIDAYLNKP